MAQCELEGKNFKKAQQDAQDATRAHLSALRNAVKRDDIMAQIEKNGGISNALETLRSVLHGSNKLGRENIESSWHGRSNQWQAVLDNELFKAGLKKAAYSGQMDADVAKEWWNINNGKSASKSPAGTVANLYAKVLDSIRDRQNAAGAYIGDALNYVTRTTYDPVKMRQAAGANKSAEEAFNSWWQKTEPRLSDKNFQGIQVKAGQTINDARREVAREIYDSLVTGIHLKVGGEADTGFVHPDYAGTSDIAAQVSANRELLWKDADAWHGNMKDFGQYPNLNASVMMSIDRGARSLAMMERLGDNPGANLNMLIRRVEETYRGDVDAVGKFRDKAQGLRNVMGRLDGSLNIPADMGLAKGANALRTWESISDLGGVGMTHFASIWPTVTSELAQHGVNRLEGLGSIVRALTTGMGAEERRDILADLGAYADGPMRHTQSVIGDDSIPGRISAIASRFMDFTGIHFVFDRTKAGVRDMLSHNLARNVTKSFDELDPHISQMLGKYGITAEDWKIIQATKDLPTWNGRQYLTPSSVGDQTISDKLLSYYTDAAAHAVVSPGVRERALLLGSTRPGTGWGEMARFLTQFKMWPVAAMHQILERDIFMSLSKKEAAWNLGMLFAIGIPAGYLRMSVNDEVMGHPLRDPTDPKTLLAAAAQSGGLGILGDFLFGETSRMGGGLVSTVGGPIVGDADSLIHIFNEWKEGKAGWPDLAHFAVRHIPFANLIYLKGALDYLMWYHLYEAASPGWWERTNRRLQKEQGRTMTGYVPGGGVPWGVPGIYLQNKTGESSGAFGSKQLDQQMH